MVKASSWRQRRLQSSSSGVNRRVLSLFRALFSNSEWFYVNKKKERKQTSKIRFDFFSVQSQAVSPAWGELSFTWKW